MELLQPFTTWAGRQEFFEELITSLQNADPVITLLALEGLYRIESDVESGQFPHLRSPLVSQCRNFLREWRCESPLSGAYDKKNNFNRIKKLLKSLTIFKTLEVPMFVDDYGDKRLMTSFRDSEDIIVDGNTPIYHVTHSEEAEKIQRQRQLKPSDKKNIIKGSWFGLDNSPSSYGSKSFETTLYKLNVTGLRQGEIVSYKKEVNVILYAVDDKEGFEDLKKPTLEAAREIMQANDAYVKVSIFVPSRFLPSPDIFEEVFDGPSNVIHPFCVKEMRFIGSYTCTEKACQPPTSQMGYSNFYLHPPAVGEPFQRLLPRLEFPGTIIAHTPGISRWNQPPLSGISRQNQPPSLGISRWNQSPLPWNFQVETIPPSSEFPQVETTSLEFHRL